MISTILLLSVSGDTTFVRRVRLQPHSRLPVARRRRGFRSSPSLPLPLLVFRDFLAFRFPMVNTAPKRKNASSRKGEGKRAKGGNSEEAGVEVGAVAIDGNGLFASDDRSNQGDSETTHSVGGAELAKVNRKREAKQARKLKGELLILVRTSN